MKQKLLFIFCCVLYTATKAQVTISAQFAPSGMVQKDQLWNITVVNNMTDALDISVRLNVQEATTGEIVMTANSGNLFLNKGVKILNAADAQPILYNYSRDNFSRSFLPAGSYVACYQLYRVSDKGEELLGDECIKIIVEPVSPPLLMSPLDKEEITTPYPLFTWIPPAPVDILSNLKYEIIVVEMTEQQSAVEAIQQNTPVYTNTGISAPRENYASSFSALKAGKTYAWQVIATDENNYAAKTEVWSFKIASPSVKGVTGTSESFAVASPDYTGKTYHFNGKGQLNISIVNPYLEKEMKYAITSLSDSRRINHLPKVTVKSGLNNISIPVKKIHGLKKGEKYLMEIYDVQNSTYYINFTITEK